MATDHLFRYQIDNGEVAITDNWAGVYTRLGFNYDWYGITEPQVRSYLKSLFSHIGYVREACERLQIPLQQAKVHDYSKFNLAEFPYYVRQFHGDKADPDGFARAWLHHIHNNPHHWQHWLFADGFTPDDSCVESGCVEMPEEYAAEMVADWMGASMAYTGSWDLAGWLSQNTPKIRVHTQTAAYLTRLLDSMGYMDYCAFAVKEHEH